ncbi:TetR/AcrR family transcriptional regulator [Futiania mangrovi]|uniref:TetR/AcrR family transcriptional regulator n=1 Tax=Futiania mangrovi TaxID=2959716 RepID=A0A9J6PCC2_9PROT|nr:TetR/AcrR family transcriptional regulator [Futiania mangrovii]MCP1336201.1 TetR/AcrR family transcriptional regulator [Futiania mangrovii]
MDSITPRGKRALNKEANRDAILEAAQDVFAELSFGGSSVRDIIARTGLASGTFYNYFRSKEEIFCALLEEMGAELRSGLQELPGQYPGCIAHARSCFEVYYRCILRNRGLYLVLRRNMGTVRSQVEMQGTLFGFSFFIKDIEAAVSHGGLSDAENRRITAASLGLALEVGDELLQQESPDIFGAASFSAEFLIGGIMMIKNLSQSKQANQIKIA